MQMRMMLGVFLGSALLTGGCATGHDNARDNAHAAWDTTKEGFGVAYDGVKSGAKGVAHVGGWVLEKAGNGVVRVMYMAHMGKVARVTEDGWITTKLKGEYGLDPRVKASHINIDTSGGVVTLTGIVDSPNEAQAAIERALTTDGVREVRSNLSWPTTHQSRTFEKGDTVDMRSRR